MPCKNHPSVEEPIVYCVRCGGAFCPNCIVEISGSPYCAVCKSEVLGDLRSGLPARGLDAASIGRRFGALFLDGLILNLPLTAIILGVFFALGAFNLNDPANPVNPLLFLTMEGVLIVATLGAWILYEGLMLARDGQTLGKKALRIRVVSAAGGPLSTGQAFGRAAMRKVFELVPCMGLIDYLMAFGEQRTCIHDMVARTRVVNWDA
ncbi:MAG TPA: RDD family protein [Thermoanaerobaculia bacterium]|nr:RDD family protein [Thermoanaerobaculia bacterium]